MDSISLTQVVVGIACLAAALAARPLVGLNLWLYGKVGLSGLADTWERRLGWWVPTVRAVAVAPGLVLLAMGTGVLQSH